MVHLKTSQTVFYNNYKFIPEMRTPLKSGQWSQMCPEQVGSTVCNSSYTDNISFTYN